MTETYEPTDCHDCGVKEGQLHVFGCDMELCPVCGWQLIGCEHLHTLNEMPFTERPSRIPWIFYPIICAKCGALWPEFFRVPDEEWERYVQPDMRDHVLCLACYERIKAMIDAAATLEREA